MLPHSKTSSPTRLLQGAPVLHVRDPLATAAFYQDVLGFHLDYGDGYYSVIRRDNSAIHLVKDNQNPTGIHLFHLVEDVSAYHNEVVDRGAEITRDLADQPYGLREFALRDINGIEIIFGQEVREADDDE
ncbi:MAG: VOC family protein [Pseudomonadales bacterium]|jgi:uncharacterized glyoxalase superfamily protein PhnB|nr:VOC family protein [Pseudomonadales bacterium]